MYGCHLEMVLWNSIQYKNTNALWFFLVEETFHSNNIQEKKIAALIKTLIAAGSGNKTVESYI